MGFGKTIPMVVSKGYESLQQHDIVFAASRRIEDRLMRELNQDSLNRRDDASPLH